MPRSGNHLYSHNRNVKPADEIARVDAAIEGLVSRLAIPPDEMTVIGELPASFRMAGTVALPIAIRSLRKYRQRLCRAR